MTASPTAPTTPRDPELLGQSVVVIEGSAGIGLETARKARAEGAEVALAGRDAVRLQHAAVDVDARSTAAFDPNDPASLTRFFDGLPDPIDHVMVTAGGPHYGPMLDMDSAEVREAISDHVVVALEVARHAARKMRPGGTLLLIRATAGRSISREIGIASVATAVLPPFTTALALELAPEKITVIHSGIPAAFFDTPLSASLLGDRLEERRNELRAMLPIGAS
jgi:NAD(P)-dependent dehydrogenase (short-subunit alcohol dehydrogenase family)